MLENSCIAAQLAASQEGLSSMELDSSLVMSALSLLIRLEGGVCAEENHEPHDISK
jgi:hypothetical protein